MGWGAVEAGVCVEDRGCVEARFVARLTSPICGVGEGEWMAASRMAWQAFSREDRQEEPAAVVEQSVWAESGYGDEMRRSSLLMKMQVVGSV